MDGFGMQEISVAELINMMKKGERITPEELTYWELREDRTYFIDYEINEMYDLIELSKVIVQMNIKEKDIPKEELKPIYIFIHTFGGDVYQSAIFSDILLASRIPIVTVAMGATMSAGFDIFLAGSKRYCFEHSQLLLHAGYNSLSGTAGEIEEAQKNYKKQLEESKQYILSRTTMPEKDFNKHKKDDWYLTIDEVKKYNIATVVSSFDEIFS